MPHSRSRHLRATFLNAELRCSAPKPAEVLESASIARCPDASDKTWRTVDGLGHVAEFSRGSTQADCSPLSGTLGTLVQNFTSSGKHYAAAAAREAQRRCESTSDDMDASKMFHPALWAHINTLQRSEVTNNQRLPNPNSFPEAPS